MSDKDLQRVTKCVADIGHESARRALPLAVNTSPKKFASPVSALTANKASLMKESLTPRQEKFCQEIVAGNTQSEAYREAYKPKNANHDSIHVNASKLMAKTKIQLRVEELRKPIVQHIQADRLRWL
jgi:hypothetical protein